MLLWAPQQVWADAGERNLERSGSGLSFYSAVDVGLSRLDEDLFFDLLLEQQIAWTSGSLVLSGPFRFVVDDNDPQQSGALRGADWDEASDFSRIVRSFELRRELEDGQLSFELGEQNGVNLGYGALVSHFYNSLDMDHAHGGVLARAKVNGHGASFLMHDVIAPGVFAGRAFVSPLAFFTHSEWSKRLVFGATVGFDSGVPHRVVNTGRRRIVPFSTDGALVFATGRRAQGALLAQVGGLDGDVGVHGGASGRFVLSPPNEVTLFATAEYRYLGSDYLPGLFNPFYLVNRRFYTVDPLTGEEQTLAEHLASEQTSFPAAHGFSAEVSLVAGKRFSLSTHYDYQGPNRPHWLLFNLTVSPSSRLRFTGLFAGQDLLGGRRIVSAQSVFGVGVHYRILGPLRGYLELMHSDRRISRDDHHVAFGTSGGAGVIFSYE